MLCQRGALATATARPSNLAVIIPLLIVYRWLGVPVKVACRQLVTPRLLKTKYLYFVPYLDNLEISQLVGKV